VRTGDIIVRHGLRWTVRAVDRRSRLATILNEDLKFDWIPIDLDKKQPDGCQVICNPPDEWPFIAIATKGKRGRLVLINRVPMGLQEQPIAQWHDWVAADPMRVGGGPVFFNPELRLTPSETLIAIFDKGLPARVTVPLGFGTVQQRKDRLTAKPTEQKTAFDKLLDDDPYGEDE